MTTTGEADLLREIDDLIGSKSDPASHVVWDGEVVAVNARFVRRCRTSIAENASLRAKLDERAAERRSLDHFKANAERYLWLREPYSKRRPGCQLCVMQHYHGDRLDDAIDWAIRQSAQSAQAASQPET